MTIQLDEYHILASYAGVLACMPALMLQTADRVAVAHLDRLYGRDIPLLKIPHGEKNSAPSWCNIASLRDNENCLEDSAADGSYLIVLWHSFEIPANPFEIAIGHVSPQNWNAHARKWYF
jgi:hypothetical protein